MIIQASPFLVALLAIQFLAAYYLPGITTAVLFFYFISIDLFGLAYAIQNEYLSIASIDGLSMYKTFYDGDYVILETLSCSYRIDDVVAVPNPEVEGEMLVKRIKGIEYDATVGQDTLFLRGGNIKDSIDSLQYGNFKVDAVIGKVIVHASMPIWMDW